MPTAPRCGKHLDVVAIHLVLERCRSHLVQAFKLERHPAAIGKDEAVEADSEAGLIAVGYGLSRTDGAGSPGDQDALAVAGVEGHGNLGQGGAGEVSRELGNQRAFRGTIPRRCVQSPPDRQGWSPWRDSPENALATGFGAAGGPAAAGGSMGCLDRSAEVTPGLASCIMFSAARCKFRICSGVGIGSGNGRSSELGSCGDLGRSPLARCRPGGMHDGL